MWIPLLMGVGRLVKCLCRVPPTPLSSASVECLCQIRIHRAFYKVHRAFYKLHRAFYKMHIPRPVFQDPFSVPPIVGWIDFGEMDIFVAENGTLC